MSDNCIFCKIASGVIPADLIYQDEHFVAFHDITPQAPVHVLCRFQKLTTLLCWPGY
jgi:histidine triad (HIT) family protein